MKRPPSAATPLTGATEDPLLIRIAAGRGRKVSQPPGILVFGRMLNE